MDWMDMQDDPRDEHRPCATEAEAHVEWHLNSGVPMGQPGCPWDACDLTIGDIEEQEQWEEHTRERVEQMRREREEPDSDDEAPQRRQSDDPDYDEAEQQAAEEPPCTDPRPDPRTHPEYWTE